MLSTPGARNRFYSATTQCRKASGTVSEQEDYFSFYLMILSSHTTTIPTGRRLRGHSRSVAQMSEDSILSRLGRSAEGQPRLPALTVHLTPVGPSRRWGLAARLSLLAGIYSAAHRGAPCPAATGRAGSAAGTVSHGRPAREARAAAQRRPKVGEEKKPSRDPSAAQAPPRTRRQAERPERDSSSAPPAAAMAAAARAWPPAGLVPGPTDPLPSALKARCQRTSWRAGLQPRQPGGAGSGSRRASGAVPDNGLVHQNWFPAV